MIVTVCAGEVVLTSLNTHFGTPRVVAVGSVTATATEPMYSTRFGLQSVDRMVSEAVMPLTARPTMPGRDSAGGLLTPPEGVLVSVYGTPAGVVNGVTQLTVVAAV